MKILIIIALSIISSKALAISCVNMAKSKSFDNHKNFIERTSPKALSNWLINIKENNVESMSSLYAPGADFLPTYSPRLHNTKKLTREYFTSFLAKENLAAKLKTIDYRKKLDNDHEFISGTYEFSWGPKNEFSQLANYSYIINSNKLGESVLLHHSSVDRLTKFASRNMFKILQRAEKTFNSKYLVKSIIFENHIGQRFRTNQLFEIKSTSFEILIFEHSSRLP